MEDDKPTRDDVILCYSAILLREPENELVIDEHIERGSIRKIVEALASSNEFNEKRRHNGIEIVQFRDMQIAIPKRDWMLDPIRNTGDYEPYVIQPFLDLLSGSSNFLDIGANVGTFTLQAAKKAKTVVSIEASSDNAKLLAANVVMNCLKNVTIYPVAVAAKPGLVTFSRVTSTTNKHMEDLTITPETFDDIEVTMGMPIDSLVDRKFDVVKIDVEGKEYESLAPASHLFEQRPIFITEFNPVFARTRSGVSGETYLNLFFSRGYRASILHRDMTIETDIDASQIDFRWCEYMSRNITHVDVMFEPT